MLYTYMYICIESYSLKLNSTLVHIQLCTYINQSDFYSIIILWVMRQPFNGQLYHITQPNNVITQVCGELDCLISIYCQDVLKGLLYKIRVCTYIHTYIFGTHTHMYLCMQLTFYKFPRKNNMYRIEEIHKLIACVYAIYCAYTYIRTCYIAIVHIHTYKYVSMWLPLLN